jgi:hypothetical protein
MANNENMVSKAAEAVKDDRVEVFVPKGYANDDPNFFVSVNGVNYLLPRGKKSMVPAHVAAEIERSKKAAERQDEKMEQMLEASK